MTIKELENRTGMTRANIRFYEGEGLLRPKRQDNGYRDYLEDDARTLEKIKLLRQIGLDIDTIRKVQSGALTLEQALFSQLSRLEGDKAVLERAAEVCRELERTGVEYDALDPQPWLAQLQPPSRPGLPEPPLPAAPGEDARDYEPRVCYCPWQRFFARELDTVLYRAVFYVPWLFLLRDQSLIRLQANTFGSWAWNLGILVLALVLEPLWLHFWGWTPGKWLFGLKVRDEDGSKLSIAQAGARCWHLIGAGYGWNIPILNLWLMWRCRSAGLDGRDCPWDVENGYRYTKEERRIHPGGIYVLAAAVSFAVTFAGLKYTQTPPNQGPLTAAEFAENYNYYLNQLVDQNSSGLPALGGNGRWIEKEESGVSVVHLFGDTTVWARPEITLTDGFVTAVTLRMESRDQIVSTGTRELLAMLALSGSTHGTDLFRYNLAGWVKTAEETLYQWENVELDYRGLHISQQVEYTGYDSWGSALHGASDGNPSCHCKKTMTISLIE